MAATLQDEKVKVTPEQKALILEADKNTKTQEEFAAAVDAILKAPVQDPAQDPQPTGQDPDLAGAAGAGFSPGMGQQGVNVLPTQEDWDYLRPKFRGLLGELTQATGETAHGAGVFLDGAALYLDRAPLPESLKGHLRKNTRNYRRASGAAETTAGAFREAAEFVREDPRGTHPYFEGVGQVTGDVLPVLGMAAMGVPPVALVGTMWSQSFLKEGVEAHAQALANGATPDQANAAFVLYGAGAASLELGFGPQKLIAKMGRKAKPVSRILKRIDKATDGSLTYLMERMGKGGRGALMGAGELPEEHMQLLWAQIVAKNIHDDELDILAKWEEGAREMGLVPAVVGVIVGGGVGIAHSQMAKAEKAKQEAEGSKPIRPSEFEAEAIDSKGALDEATVEVDPEGLPIKPEDKPGEPVLVDEKQEKKEPSIVEPMEEEAQPLQEPQTLTEEEQAESLKDFGKVAKNREELQKLRAGKGAVKPEEDVEVETRPVEEEAVPTQTREEAEAAYPTAGEEVDGRKVLGHVPNLSSIESSITDPDEFGGVREVPLSAFTLDEAPLATDKRTLDLAEKIKQSGEIKPLIVGIDEKGPYIIEGAHRYDALKILGAKSFPAVVVAEGDAFVAPSPKLKVEPQPSKKPEPAEPKVPKAFRPKPTPVPNPEPDILGIGMRDPETPETLLREIYKAPFVVDEDLIDEDAENYPSKEDVSPVELFETFEGKRNEGKTFGNLRAQKHRDQSLQIADPTLESEKGGTRQLTKVKRKTEEEASRIRERILYHQAAREAQESGQTLEEIFDQEVRALEERAQASEDTLGSIAAEEQLARAKEHLAKLQEARELSPAELALAEEIFEEQDLGTKILKGRKRVKNPVRRYLPRIYVPEEGEFSGKGKFKRTTGRFKHRTFPTLAHALFSGRELVSYDAVELQRLGFQDVIAVEHNNAFVKAGTRYGAFSVGHQPKDAKGGDWVKIQDPGFTQWAHVGQKAQEGEVYDRDLRIDSEGNIFRRQPVYAPKELARFLNNMFNRGKSLAQLSSLPSRGKAILQGVEDFNKRWKGRMLFFSMFHHQAFGRSFILPGKGLETMHPIQSYRSGYSYAEQFGPEVRLLLNNGLTLGARQDFDTYMAKQQGLLDKYIIKFKPTAKIRETMQRFMEQETEFLFNRLGTGLKLKAALGDLRETLESNRAAIERGDMTVEQVAADVSQRLNKDFGGLNLDRMGRDPGIQAGMHLGFLAPDWTESNFDLAVSAFRGGLEGKGARRLWARTFAKVAIASAIWNFLMAAIEAGDDPDEDAVDKFISNYKSAWKTGRLVWLGPDVTVPYQAMRKLFGKEPDFKRKYFSLLGHFQDPVKWMTQPVGKSLAHKSSIVGSMALEWGTGEDWAGRHFTTLGELMGVDDKGFYKTTSKKRGYTVGDRKGGQMGGQTVNWRSAAHGPIEFDFSDPMGTTIPSYTISTMMGLFPIPAQNAAAFLAGEMDWFDAISKSTGFKTATTYPEKE